MSSVGSVSSESSVSSSSSWHEEEKSEEKGTLEGVYIHGECTKDKPLWASLIMQAVLCGFLIA